MTSRNRLNGDPFKTDVLPSGAGTYQDSLDLDMLVVPVNYAGAHTIQLNGTLRSQPPPADGDQLIISDPFGVISAGAPLTIIGKLGTVGKQLADLTGALVDSTAFTARGIAISLTYSQAIGAWVCAPLAASGASVAAVIFDGGSVSQNARTTRSAQQSPIINTKNGIVNLGSDSTGVALGATGNYSCIPGGDACATTGDNSFAMGDRCVASGDTSLAMNLLTTASGNSSFAHGNATVASGNRSHAEGDATLASGGSSHAEGELTVSSGLASHAMGISSKASRSSQEAFSSGQQDAVGDAQTSRLVLMGFSSGTGPGQNVELALGTGEVFSLEDGKAYNVDVTLCAGGIVPAVGIPPNRFCHSFKQSFSIRRDAGVSVITGSSVQVDYGDAAAAWSMTVSIGAGPDRVKIVFGTAATTAQCGIVAKVEFQEVAYPV